ncbi:uncharacterized protein BDV17DRAFT_157000 [Aspergillus undulatus]|uniref:uncharacterized protein n=1 Tax=Aspergillus undulatus TaxID=1810928 RepID=UPI003CCDA921
MFSLFRFAEYTLHRPPALNFPGLPLLELQSRAFGPSVRLRGGRLILFILIYHLAYFIDIVIAQLAWIYNSIKTCRGLAIDNFGSLHLRMRNFRAKRLKSMC